MQKPKYLLKSLHLTKFLSFLKKQERQFYLLPGIKFTFAPFGNGRGLVAQLVRAADS